MSESPPRMADRLQRDYAWTARQKEVLSLLAHGRSNSEIAEHLGVSLAGAKWHVAEILSKLQAESREEAAEYWRRYTGVGPRFARVFRGGMALGGWKLAAIAGGVVAASALGLALLRSGGDAPRSAGELITDAVEEMDATSFSLVGRECDDCPIQTLVEFSPQGMEVTNFERVGENWPHYLLVPGGAWVSEEGLRWHDERDGIIGAFLIADPRFILRGMEDSRVTGAKDGPAGACTLVEGTLSIERLQPHIPPALDPSNVDLYREFLHGGTAQVCIESADSRVRWMHVRLGNGEEGPLPVTFDYDAPVDIPATVDAMDRDRASQLDQRVERIGEQLLDAISRYHDANGRYPAELTPATLGVDSARFGEIVPRDDR